MATILRDHNSPSLVIDGTMDHVHILFALGRTITIADLVEELKTGSSKWIKTKGREFKNFHWQKGYGVFSIGQSNVVALKRYIRSQKQHHRFHAEGVRCNSQGQRPWKRMKKIFAESAK